MSLGSVFDLVFATSALIVEMSRFERSENGHNYGDDTDLNLTLFESWRSKLLVAKPSQRCSFPRLRQYVRFSGEGSGQHVPFLLAS